jgi:hypothetical protein
MEITSRRMGWARHVIRTEDLINAYKILVGKSVRKRPLGRSKGAREYNIR